MEDMYRYTYEKLAEAVDTLATHPGRITERLIAAYIGQASRLDGAEDPDLASRIERLHNAMSTASADMAEERARELAEVITDLNDRVTALYWQHRSALAARERGDHHAGCEPGDDSFSRLVDHPDASPADSRQGQ